MSCARQPARLLGASRRPSPSSSSVSSSSSASSLASQFASLSLRQTPASSRGLATNDNRTTHKGYRQYTLPEGEIPIPRPTTRDPLIPAYPLGPRRIYKQSNTGLYGLARLRTGNNVSEKHDVKTLRQWRPNIHQKKLRSAALGTWVRTKISSRVLRSVDKAGGLDEYLLGEKAARIAELGPWGWKLRWRVMQTPAVQERYARQREALGLPPKGEDAVTVEAARMLADEGYTAEEVIAETDQMLESEQVAEEEVVLRSEDGFMREEKPTNDRP